MHAVDETRHTEREEAYREKESDGGREGGEERGRDGGGREKGAQRGVRVDARVRSRRYRRRCAKAVADLLLEESRRTPSASFSSEKARSSTCAHVGKGSACSQTRRCMLMELLVGEGAELDLPRPA